MRLDGTGQIVYLHGWISAPKIMILSPLMKRDLSSQVTYSSVKTTLKAHKKNDTNVFLQQFAFLSVRMLSDREAIELVGKSNTSSLGC
jgi:hypothetical protein